MDATNTTGLSESQMRALAASTLVWTASADGEMSDTNPAWSAFTGQSLQEYAGEGWLQVVHPDDRLAARTGWRHSVESLLPVRLTCRLRGRDGHYRVMRVAGAPVLQEGRAIGWVGSCHDITDLQRTEEALRQSEERFRFLDALGLAARPLTDSAEIMAVSARLLGQHLAAARCAYADMESDQDTFTIRADWSRAGVPSCAGIYSLTSFGLQARHHLGSGRFLVVHDVDRELGEDGAPTFNAIGIKAIICAPLVKSGRLLALMAVHSDVPRAWTEAEVALVGEVVDRCWAHIERVRAASLLKEQEQRKDEFLATLAHELRNPLAPMRYAAAIMNRAPAGSTQALRALRVVERQTDLMARLVDDLLDLSRINRGLIELRVERLDLRDVVEQAVDSARHALDQAGHALQLSLPPGPLQVDGDPARLVQAISNLLNNAAKYTPDGGEIRLAAWESGHRATVEVCDNGIGIPPEEQGRLFQMFSQLPRAARRSQGGLGIGLALVRTLVQLHGGSVRAHSAGIDQGSRFSIELPLARVPEAVQGAPAAAVGGTHGPSSRPRILVVEDNCDGRETLLALLEMMGYEAHGTADGEAGLALALAIRPDIALLDLGLPGMDGLSLARALRERAPLADLRLVALTGWGAETDRVKTRAAGFDRHLTKPVDVDQLEALLEELGRRQAPSSP